MSWDVVARRYARAFLELGKEDGSLERLAKDIANFAEVYEGSEELQAVLNNPLVQDTSREGVLAEVCSTLGLSPLALNGLRLVARRRRLPCLGAMARQLERLVDEDRGILRVSVTSAGPLSQSYLDKLRAEIEVLTHKQVHLSHHQDPSLIAGVVTQIGDQVVDGSVRARLSTFRESLLRTA